MSWQTEISQIVRHLINDLDGVTYSDARIEQAILISAQLVNSEVSFDKTYTINLTTCSISPDPTADTREDGFINLVAMRTALIVLYNEIKVLAANAVIVWDGPSKIDISNSYKAAKELYDELSKVYYRAKVQFQLGNSKGGTAILTPYTNNSINTYIWS